MKRVIVLLAFLCANIAMAQDNIGEPPACSDCYEMGGLSPDVAANNTSGGYPIIGVVRMMSAAQTDMVCVQRSDALLMLDLAKQAEATAECECGLPSRYAQALSNLTAALGQTKSQT
jgi:hypothetical protein